MARIKRFGVMKMSVFTGLYGVVIGLIAGIIFALISLVVPASSITSGTLNTGMFKLMFGVGAIVIFPIVYGVGGFLSALIFTPIMNLVLRMIKGLDLDIEMQPEPVQQTKQAVN